MEPIYTQSFKSPYGELLLGSYEGQLCLSDWKYRRMRESVDSRITKGLGAAYVEMETQVTALAIEQLKEYFSGKRKEFNIRLLMVGSAFQLKVWNELLRIPYGETETYLGLSEKLGNRRAIRAVASANGANALSIFVPCHRIIGTNKAMVGYAVALR